MKSKKILSFISVLFLLFFPVFSEQTYLTQEKELQRLKALQKSLENKIEVLNSVLILFPESPKNVKKLIGNYEAQLSNLKKTKDDIQETLTASIQNLTLQNESLTESEERQKQEVEKQLKRVRISEERLKSLEKLLQKLKKERLIENLAYGTAGIGIGILVTIIVQGIIKLGE